MANIIIVGGGVAGLSAGIYAQLKGHNATIYEKHFKYGGNLTGWDRDGYHIDNCIHWLTGTNPNTDLYKMWRELGVLGNVEIYQGETLYTFQKDGESMSLYNDIEKVKEEMLRISPFDEKEILSFIKAVKAVQGLSGIAGENHNEKSSLLKKIRDIPVLLKYYKLTTGELSEKFIHPVLKGFIASVISEHFSSLALILVFATFCGNNGGIPAGSSCAMADRMAERFLSLGGKLHLKQGVEKINVVDGAAESVVLESGEIKPADYVIVTSDPAVAFGKLLDETLMPKELKNLYDNPNMMRFSSYHCAFSCDISDLPFRGDMIVEIPEEYRESLRGEYLIMREFSHETGFAPKGKNVLQTMIYCMEDTAKDFIELSKNQSLYKEKKKSLAENIKEIIIDKFPEFKKKIKCIDVWTPATYKRYTDSQIGSFMSFALPSKTIPHRLSNKIDGVKNVILATQWLQMPGGLPIAARVGKSAIDTIREIEKSKR